MAYFAASAAIVAVQATEARAHAATRIQAAGRGYIFRRAARACRDKASCIQACWRGCLLRRYLAEWHWTAVQAATIMQAAARGFAIRYAVRKEAWKQYDGLEEPELRGFSSWRGMSDAELEDWVLREAEKSTPSEDFLAWRKFEMESLRTDKVTAAERKRTGLQRLARNKHVEIEVERRGAANSGLNIKCCTTCGTTKAPLQTCARCKNDKVSECARYCSRKCQKRHWPEHKLWHEQHQSALISEVAVRESLRAGLDKSLDAAEAASASGDVFKITIAQARVHVCAGDFKRAGNLLKKAMKEDPAASEPYLLMAGLHKLSNDNERAYYTFLQVAHRSQEGSREWYQACGEAWNHRCQIVKSTPCGSFWCSKPCCAKRPKMPAWMATAKALRSFARDALKMEPQNENAWLMYANASECLPDGLELAGDAFWVVGQLSASSDAHNFETWAAANLTHKMAEPDSVYYERRAGESYESVADCKREDALSLVDTMLNLMRARDIFGVQIDIEGTKPFLEEQFAKRAEEERRERVMLESLAQRAGVRVSGIADFRNKWLQIGQQAVRQKVMAEQEQDRGDD